MTAVLFIIGIISILTAIAMYCNKLNIVKIVIFTLLTFFSQYVLVSGVMFWMDVFRVNNVLLFIALINITVCGILYFKGKRIDYILDCKRYLIPLIVFIIMLPLVFTKYGFFGMGQDEGVYQTHAISLMYGDTKIQHDFEEYSDLDMEDKENYRISLKEDLIGFYNYDTELPTLNEKNELSDISGVYHGVPTFAAILALWGNMFGLPNMAGVQTIFYLCYIFMVFFICENMKFGKLTKVIVTAVCAGSPIIIWVSKSSLTEIFLAVVFCFFMYQVTDKKNEKAPYLSVIPIFVFSFYHITVYTMIPVFIMVYIGMYFYEKKEIYLKCCIISILGFMSGITMIAYTGATYSFVHNFIPLYTKTLAINQENVLMIILIVSFLSIAGCICIGFMGRKLHKSEHSFPYGKVMKWLFRLFVIGTVLYQIKILVNSIAAYGSILSALQHMTIVAFALLTGGVMLPVTCILFFIKPKAILKNKESLVVGILFLYCIFVYSCVLRSNIPYYYYYARYLAPFISILMIFSGIYMDRYLKKLKGILLLVSMLFFLPFDMVLGKGMDDTRVEWSTIEKLKSEAGEGATIIIDRELMKYYYLPLQALTDADIYPLLYEDIDEQVKRTKKEDTNVYYISDRPYFLNNISIIYYNKYLKSEDNNRYDGKIIPFPLKFETEEMSVICYKYNQAQTNYSVIEKNFENRGLGYIENDFAWTNLEKTYFRFYLEKDDYTMQIIPGALIPFDHISMDSIKINAYINDSYVGSVLVNKENCNEPLNFEINKEQVGEDENIVILESKLWLASEVMAEDNRHLGISIKEINFVRKQEK